jgi:hypothetical protein
LVHQLASVQTEAHWTISVWNRYSPHRQHVVMKNCVLNRSTTGRWVALKYTVDPTQKRLVSVFRDITIFLEIIRANATRIQLNEDEIVT